jgi:hypothetical protein
VASEGIANARSTTHRPESLVVVARHYEGRPFRLHGEFLTVRISVSKLQLMGSEHVGSGTVVQDDGIPDDFISTLFSKYSLGFLFPPAL